MPSLNDNIKVWANDKMWPMDGDGWSEAWGGVDKHWGRVIYPRILSNINDNVLEIASGRGRWTHYLSNIQYVDRVDAVDVQPSCIDFCKKRFKDNPKVHLHQNDGYTVPMIPDQSVNFVFSYDSLVHCEIDVIESYLKEIKRVLKPWCIAFLHHSNLLSYPLAENRGWRASSVNAQEVEKIVKSLGMSVKEQEETTWGLDDGNLTDCMSTIINVSDLKTHNIKNFNFMKEAYNIREGIKDDTES